MLYNFSSTAKIANSNTSSMYDNAPLRANFTSLRQKRFAAAGAVLAIVTLCLLAVSSRDSISSTYTTYACSFRAGSAAYDDGLNAILGSPTTREDQGFILVAPTFHRLDTLQQWVTHYANGSIPSLRRIVLLPGDPESEPTEEMMRIFNDLPVEIVVDRRTPDSLNQRFRKTALITTECVLSMDDDLIFDPTDIEFGYQTWKEFGQGRRRMVGYVPREVKYEREYILGRLHSYNIVLTKAAFFHVDWMDLYWSDQMSSLRDYVDEHHNCEDILMGFLTAHHTGASPIFVKAALKDIGRKTEDKSAGISSTSGHGMHRGDCVKHFYGVFGKDTMVSSSTMVKNMELPDAEDSGADW